MLRKRKRKNSAEGATAPRVTRQRRVPVGSEERDSTVAESAIRSPGTPRAPKTPATERRSTRKKNVTAASQDLTMSTRSRKAIPSESLRDSDAENAVDPSKPKSKRAASTRRVTKSVATDETHSTRSRAKKEAQDSTEKSCLPKQKRRTRKKRVSTEKSTTRSKRSNPVTETGDKNSSMQLKLNRISLVGISQNTPRKYSSSLMSLVVDAVTPESSPLLVTLTPHRSSKTPKKSPVNIGSPKTHSQSPLRLSKTPRKLTVSVESPATSDKSSVSVANQSPANSKTQQNSHVMLVDFMKQASESSPQLVAEPSPNKSSKKLSSSFLTINEIWDQVVASSPIATSSRRIRISASKIKKSPVSTSPRILNPTNSESPKRLRSSKKLDDSTGVAEVTSRKSLRLTPDFTKFAEDSTSSPNPTSKKMARVLPQVFRRSEEANDQSLELLDCNEFVDVSGNCVSLQMNGTFDVVAEKQEDEIEITNKKKTPSPHRKGVKRSLDNGETSHCTTEAKKRCRVRFASPSVEDKGKASPGLMPKSLPAFGTPGKERIGARSIIGSIDPGRSKRRSRSLTKIEDKTPSTRSGAKRRSNSASALPQRTPQLSQSIQSSVNRLSRPRQAVASEPKSEAKVPVARKIPNFAQIHQKKFEKMESLVDAKKRVAKRHEELKTAAPPRASPRSSSAPAVSLPKKPTSVPPPKTQNNEFTRFGFKLRKVEAVNMMTKKAPAAARIKNHVVSNRTVLRDVRTNKRFELQMKFRKIADEKR